MGGVRFELETRASPDQVRRALTDFSDRRLHTWRRSLDPQTYELRDHGEHWAIARESSSRSPACVVSRYDWSEPDVVRWSVVDSSYGGGGDGFVRSTPRADGGTTVHAEWRATDPTRQRLLLFLIHHGPANRLFSRLWASALEEYAREDSR
jgi:hypothetical protein